MPEQIVSLNEKSLKANLRKFVRRSVENTLNGLIEREVSRTGHSERKLAMTSSKVALRMSKPKRMRFTSAIIERHRRREA